MRTAETITGLAAFERRGPGTDAERRASRWLAGELGAARRAVRVETFWCRPNWAFAHAWHVALGLAGSLVAVSSASIGGALVLVALLSLLVDERLGMSLGRRLTREHASQNILALPQAKTGAPPPGNQVHLIITANYDAGRAGVAYRDWLRAPFARFQRIAGGRAPGWLAWTAIALIWLLVVAIVRTQGGTGSAIGAAQLIPTVGLVLALALLLDLATADFGPAANDNASGVAVALALARALNAAPPSSRVSAEVLLTGAGDGFGLGLRSHLRANRGKLRAANTVVLGIAPSASGQPRWWRSDGQLVPLRYFERLHRICAQLAGEQPKLEFTTHRGRGATPAFPARSRRLPAIAIGCLDERGLTPRSHQARDTAEAVDSGTLDTTVHLGLMLIDAIDSFLQERPAPPQNRSGWSDRIALRRPFPLLGGRERKSADQLRT